jgi:hypothetical protein
VAVLKFTAAGIVSAPTAVQVRVSRALPGRIAAGAPAPGRAMTDDEVRDNLHYFASGRVGPRSVACTTVVLAGGDLPSRPALAPILDDARGWGVRRVVLHLGRGGRHALRGSPLRTRVDEVALGVWGAADVADVRALVGAPARVVAVVTLDAPTLARLDGLARALAAARPARVVLTWPLAGEPPHAARVAPALVGPVDALRAGGVDVGIKGLPPCTFGELGALCSRTRNRLYVDADHQRDRALLLFPDVLRFERVDACRFCAAAPRCDGAPSGALAAGLVGPLRPL